MRLRYLHPCITLSNAGLSASFLFSLIGCGVTAPTLSSTSSPSGTAKVATVASGPTLGYLWDPAAGGLRVVYGLPGAAHEGAATYDSGTFSGATVCSPKSFALLLAKTGSVSLTSLPVGEPAQVAAKLSATQQVLLSPSCSSALIYAPDAANGFLIQGLPSKPQTTQILLSASGSILGAAVADSGSVLVATVGADGSAIIQAIASGSKSANSVGVLSKYGGMVFLPQSDKALLADAAKNVVILASQITGNISLAPIAGSVDGVSQPVAVASSADGLTAVVANSSGPAILRIDLSQQTSPVKIACNCSPSELVPLSGNLVFRLNEPGTGTVWAFDGDSSTSRTVFLPTEQLTKTSGVAQ
jgi:hypothetical protein